MSTSCAAKREVGTEQLGTPAPRVPCNPRDFPAPRVPCNRFDFTNVLALQFRERYDKKLNSELAFQKILHYFDNLIYRQASKLGSVRNSSYEDAHAEVITKIFELTLAFDPSVIHFCGYVTIKLKSWVTWEALRKHRRHKERTVLLPNEELVALAEGNDQDPTDRIFRLEARSRLANYKEDTADMLFMRHVMDFTQAEIGTVMGVHQQAVNKRLRYAHEHIANSGNYQDENGHNGNGHR